MPRDLALGNGRLNVNFDKRYRLRDIYHPQVGAEAHGGNEQRLGVWADGRFSWVGDDGWQIDRRYEPDALVTRVTLEHKGLALKLHLSDGVDYAKDILVRRVEAEDSSGRDREVRLFFGLDLSIRGNHWGDSAYYDPKRKAVIHYKHQHWFLHNVQPEGGGWGASAFAVGQSVPDGTRGTWMDAEDGQLGGNPVAQGCVDSIIAMHLHLPAQGRARGYYALLACEGRNEMRDLWEYLLEHGAEGLLERTRTHWSDWLTLGKEQHPALLNSFHEPVVELYHRSLLILRTQIASTGAILAATDLDVLQFNRDTYAYLWPRDGALTAHALDLAGYGQLAAKYYQFIGKVMHPDGWLFHKYDPSGNPGSSWHPWFHEGEEQLPVQEDETALCVWALAEHFRRYHDDDLVAPLYESFVLPAASWMVAYRDSRGLPRPSWDLWEERRGVHAFTLGSVVAGLQGAAMLAERFGTPADARRFGAAAREVLAATRSHLFRPELGRFARMLTLEKDGALTADPTIDAALFGLAAFGALAPDDEQLRATMKAVEERLWVKTPVGGMARYERDPYQQVSQDFGPVPGNPWFICTLWLARYKTRVATTRAELEQARNLLHWCVDRALPSGTLAEQVNPYDNEPISVSPLTWSHGEFVTAIHEYLAKERALPRD